MTYYPSLTEDIARAKELLAKGAVRPENKPDWMTEHEWLRMVGNQGGIIFVADSRAAYALLESFVEVIEVIGVEVCKVALRAHARANQG